MSQNAVLLIVFNRPNTAKIVFDSIRQARPPRLYIAADGPRAGREGEAELCEKVREIATEVDWECEVITLFRTENLGCRFGPNGAIDWFFENEESGIILEDDCLPHPDFFKYCDWALSEFKDNSKVWHINGNNFACPSSYYNDSKTCFTSLAQVWGWATWRDRWLKYQGNPFYLRAKSRETHSDWYLSKLAKMNKLFHIERLCHGLDGWDYQWQIKILDSAGLCLSPQSNLISNLGDGTDASHTRKDKRTRLKIEPIQGDLDYPELKVNTAVNAWYEKNMGLHRYWAAALNQMIMSYRRIIQVIRTIYSSSVDKPIVIASSGRSGSTLLSDAVAASLVNRKYGFKSSSVIGKIMVLFTRCFTDRLSDIKTTRCPVQKTHALYNPAFQDDAKYIFIYGDSLESALSVQKVAGQRGNRWFEEHLYHLESEGKLADILKIDILNYEKQIKSWLSADKQYVLAIHYDELWDSKDKISDFLGFEVSLPQKRLRSLKENGQEYNQALFRKLRLLINDKKLTS